MPLSVARWILDNTQLPSRDFRRIKLLNAKVRNETISAKEEAELDAILEVCLSLDTLRAQALAAVRDKSKRST